MCIDDKIAEHVAKAFHDTLLLFDRGKKKEIWIIKSFISLDDVFKFSDDIFRRDFFVVVSKEISSTSKKNFNRIAGENNNSGTTDGVIYA